MVLGALLAFSPLRLPPPPPEVGFRRIGARKAWSIQARERDEDSGLGLEIQAGAREQKVMFSEGVKEWGVGSGPIFTVDRSSDDGRLHVSVDEEEIVVRSGFQSMVSRKPCDASERIAKARRIAEEIQQGKLLPPATPDPMFRFVGRGEEFKQLQQPVIFAARSPEDVDVSSRRNDMLATEVAGLIGGFAVAVASFLVSRWKDANESEPEEKKKKVAVASDVKLDDKEKLTKIRGMAREVELEASRKDDEESVPEPLQYAAAARAQLVKKQQKAKRGDEKESEVVTLARRLGEVRRLGDGDLLPSLFAEGIENPVVSESLEGQSQTQAQVSGEAAQVNGEAGGVSSEPRGAMPRIITSYEEACEVLASLKMKKLSDDASGDLKRFPVATKVDEPKEEGHSPAPVEKRSRASSGEKDAWLKDDVLQILIRTRKNDLEGRDYFHGLPPDAKDILFKGVDEDLREDEAEQFKAWVNQRTATQSLKPASSPSSEAQPMLKPPRPRSLGGAYKTPKNNKKVWPKALQRRYDRETNPKVRKLLKELGKDLDSWIPEEVLDADFKLYQQGTEGKRELLRRWLTVLKEDAMQKGRPAGDVEQELSRYDKLQEKMSKHEALFGKAGFVNKMSDYKPRKQNTLWWLDLRYVACIMVRNAEQKVEPGLYSMNMAIDEEKETKMHVVGFEEQSDARNFCRILVPELDKLGGSTGVAVVPFEPKDLLNEVRTTEFEVTVLKKGQLQLHAGKPLEEVEARIYEIGRDLYVQERLRERSCDINAALKDFERDL